MIKLRRKLSVWLCGVSVLSMLLPSGAASGAVPAAVSQVIDSRQMDIAPGAVYNWYDMKLDRGLEKIHTIEFNPQSGDLDLQPGTTNGKVYGMQGLSQMASDADRTGNRVIAGINGDFYDLANGIPLGMFMGDGRILTSPPSDWFAFALNHDGTTLFGPSPKLTRTVTIKGKTSSITHINRLRSTDALVLYTEDYYTSTMTNELGDEVVLDIVEGDVKSGQTMKLQVAEIRKDRGNSALTAGQVVLSAAGNSRAILAGLQVGDELSASFELEAAWRNAQLVIGGSELLVKDGIVQPNSDTAVHPRSAIGVKADGTIVMFEVDGRAPGFSEGVQLQELGQLMKSLGVVQALNLDGGGSSTVVVKLPGQTARQVMNRPSDGGERKTANGLLLVNKAPEGAASKLVVQPNFERVLAGSSVNFQSYAVDNAGHPAAYAGERSWRMDPMSGTIDGTGKFTAGTAPGISELTVSGSGLEAGKATVEVVDELTQLKFPDAVQTFASGKSAVLSVIALRDGQVVRADNSQLSWRVEGPIGTIDASGTFTATNETEKNGKIYASYHGVETSMDVNVGLPPVILEDFENGLGNYLVSSSAQAVKSVASIETNEEFVRFGGKALKLEYDFTGKPGTSGAYLTVKDVASRIQIPGYPEKISMWVYGDGRTHWLRAQLRDVNGAIPIDFTDQNIGVNWTGWKYVEAVVPKGRTLPLTIDMPVRYMETQAAKKDAGVIYVDQIRALYGPTKDDMDPPVITNLSPAEGAVVHTNTPMIRAYGEDYGYNHETHPGTTLIDPDKIRLYLDGALISHALYPPEGRIWHTPEVPLADGVHQAKLQIKDLSGNQTTKEWTFTVETGAPKIVYEAPQETYAGNTYTVDLKGVKASNIRDGQIEFAFDPAKIEGLQAIKGAKLDDSMWQSTIDRVGGTIRLTWTGLQAAALGDEDWLGQISFRVKPDAAGTHEIAFRSGTIRFTDTGETPFAFFGLPVTAVIKQHLSLGWDEFGVVQGYTTEFTVKDEQGQAVEGAKLLADGAEIGMTDAQGMLETPVLTSNVKEYKLQAVKGQMFSSVMNFKVSPLAGTPAPFNISVTMGDDPATSRYIAWHTHPGIEPSVVEVVKAAEFAGFSQDHVQKFNGDSYVYSTYDLGTVRVHKAVTSGLEADTSYVYRVGDGSGNVSAQGTFRTAAAQGDHTKFLYFADSQAADLNGYKLWGNTVNRAFEEHPDAEFMVHAGDMIDSGFKESEWNMWFGAAQEKLMNSTLVALIGNHEVMGMRENNDFLAHFHQPGNGVSTLKGTNFSFDYKDMHFVVLNSEYAYEEQKEWLRQDLAKTTKKWKVVAFHRGPYGSIYDTAIVREQWVPVFDEFKVDLGINGHDHIYLRTFPMKDGHAVAEGQGTTYMVAGSTGPKFYSLTARDWQKVTDAENTQMYAAVDIQGDEMTVVTKTVGGRLVDQFTLKKSVQPETFTIGLDQAEYSLEAGESHQTVVTATYSPSGTVRTVTADTVFTVADESIASIDGHGVVKGLRAGSTTLTAQYGGQTVTAQVLVREETGQGTVTMLTGPPNVGPGESFTLRFGLAHVGQPVLAQDLSYRYDPSLYEFVDARSTADGVKIVHTGSSQATGDIRLIVVSEGIAHAISSDQVYIELNLRAKPITDASTGSIAVTGATLGDAEGHEYAAAPSSVNVEVTVPQGLPGDSNHDNRYSISDLAFAAAHYGMDQSHPDWSTIRTADYDGNGLIDIVDLVAIAKKILE
ncbi:phosphodiester glycosidase family protein [Paenibacillus sp. GCM10023248]|uniref:phosphodiester glycosidase family protein n=1 Tax=unclassified Paenibacillus TaxID=185978 RepID=UPI0023798098|nr:phosphodiester glycosidase family protein [Paenibacillus sp. MAHUQ-63]MDD9268120.1 phosphodiester glycosidase family protein [Paenibacillus sp. MAHUQ-63]